MQRNIDPLKLVRIIVDYLSPLGNSRTKAGEDPLPSEKETHQSVKSGLTTSVPRDGCLPGFCAGIQIFSGARKAALRDSSVQGQFCLHACRVSQN